MYELETKTKEIGGRNTAVKQFPVAVQGKLFPRLAKTIAPALTRVERINGKSDVRSMGPAIAELFSHLDEAESWALQLMLVSETTVNVDGQMLKLNSEAAVNHAFGPNLMALWETIMFSLEVNFGPLLDRVKVAVALAFTPPQGTE